MSTLSWVNMGEHIELGKVKLDEEEKFQENVENINLY